MERFPLYLHPLLPSISLLSLTTGWRAQCLLRSDLLSHAVRSQKPARPDEVRCLLRVLTAAPQLLPLLWPLRPRLTSGSILGWTVLNQGSGVPCHRDIYPCWKSGGDVSSSAVCSDRFSVGRGWSAGASAAGGWDQRSVDSFLLITRKTRMLLQTRVH